MQFMIKALDGENKLARRIEVRPRHLEGMEKLSSHIICAGGLLDNEGKMKGSVLILDFPSRDDLDSYLASEPYVVEQVWEKIEIETMNAQKQDLSLIPEDIRKSNYPQDVDGTNPLANRDPHTAYIGKIVDAYIIR